jgi:hypothetical protein
MGRPKKGFLSFGGGALNDLSKCVSCSEYIGNLSNLKKTSPIFLSRILGALRDECAMVDDTPELRLLRYWHWKLGPVFLVFVMMLEGG